jgi:hypothetical protein
MPRLPGPWSCKWCGTENFPEGRHPSADYCSVRCRLEAQMERRRKRRQEAKKQWSRCCAEEGKCGRLFTPKRSDQRFCSNACRQRYYRLGRAWSS